MHVVRRHTLRNILDRIKIANLTFFASVKGAEATAEGSGAGAGDQRRSQTVGHTLRDISQVFSLLAKLSNQKLLMLVLGHRDPESNKDNISFLKCHCSPEWIDILSARERQRRAPLWKCMSSPLRFSLPTPRPTLSLFAVPQIPWVNIVPTKKASQAQGSGWKIWISLSFHSRGKISECISHCIMRLAARTPERYSRDTGGDLFRYTCGIRMQMELCWDWISSPGLPYSVFSMGLWINLPLGIWVCFYVPRQVNQ